MQENAKCFIRIDKGIFEEITYKELEKRRKLRKEYKLIKALFFEQKSLREYAEIIGKHYTTVYYIKNKAIEKLKKFLKI